MLFASYTVNHHNKCNAFVQSDISKHIQITANVILLNRNRTSMLDIMIPNMNNMPSTPNHINTSWLLSNGVLSGHVTVNKNM